MVGQKKRPKVRNPSPGNKTGSGEPGLSRSSPMDEDGDP